MKLVTFNVQCIPLIDNYFNNINHTKEFIHSNSDVDLISFNELFSFKYGLFSKLFIFPLVSVVPRNFTKYLLKMMLYEGLWSSWNSWLSYTYDPKDEIIKFAQKYNYNYLKSESDDSSLDSGLLLLSKQKLGIVAQQDRIQHGFHYIFLEKGGNEIDIGRGALFAYIGDILFISTHPNATYGESRMKLEHDAEYEEYKAYRKKQFNEIKYMKDFHFGNVNKLIILGDLNINSKLDKDELDSILKLFDLKYHKPKYYEVERMTCRDMSTEPDVDHYQEEELDYILTSDNVNMKYYELDKDVVFSDHYPLFADIE
jgi:hypothetical protein